MNACFCPAITRRDAEAGQHYPKGRGAVGIPDMLVALREAVAAREPLFPAAAGAS